MTEKYSNLNTKYQKTTNLLFYCFSAFTIIVIVWSFIFQIDIVSNAEGQVIPVGEVKTIQHLEGGIIEKILVKESEYVETGQPLVVLAATASEVMWLFERGYRVQKFFPAESNGGAAALVVPRRLGRV